MLRCLYSCNLHGPHASVWKLIPSEPKSLDHSTWNLVQFSFGRRLDEPNCVRSCRRDRSTGKRMKCVDFFLNILFSSLFLYHVSLGYGSACCYNDVIDAKRVFWRLNFTQLCQWAAIPQITFLVPNVKFAAKSIHLISFGTGRRRQKVSTNTFTELGLKNRMVTSSLVSGALWRQEVWFFHYA